MDSLQSMNAKKDIKGRNPDGKKSKVVLSMFQDSQKEGALEYADWRAKMESTSRKVTRTVRSKTRCCSPWRVRLAGISGTAMNMVI